MNDRYAKGAAWGDYDGDGMLRSLRLEHTARIAGSTTTRWDGTFEDVAPRLGVIGTAGSFRLLDFWDFDNDGRLDLFVNDYAGGSRDWAASATDRPTKLVESSPLYQNLGTSGVRDVSLRSASITSSRLRWGWAFGDIDNDGFLDLYLGTGG